MVRVLKIVFVLLHALLFSCSSDKCGEYSPETHFCDVRDGKIYRHVKIGELLWMAENLNYKPNDSLKSWRNNYDYFNYKKYGRLYDWEAAKKVCPNGWRLPNVYELKNLINFARTYNKDEGINERLKSETGWNNFEDGTSGNGTDSIGFSALPGGCRDYKGEFLPTGNCGYWWLIRNTDRWWMVEDTILFDAYGICINSFECGTYEDAIMYGYNKLGYSVRCVKRDHSSDIAFSKQIEEKTNALVDFKDYGDCLDSLLKDKHGAMYKWCDRMKNDPELKSNYLEAISRKDDFLKYYEERCINALKHFQQSTASVEFRYSNAFGKPSGAYRYTHIVRPRLQVMTIARTGTGAIAKHYSSHDPTWHFETELGTEEWLDFLKVLYQLTNELKSSDKSVYVWWTLSINSFGKETSLYKGYKGKHPLDVDALEDVMYNMGRKIRTSGNMAEGELK